MDKLYYTCKHVQEVYEAMKHVVELEKAVKVEINKRVMLSRNLIIPKKISKTFIKFWIELSFGKVRGRSLTAPFCRVIL